MVIMSIHGLKGLDISLLLTLFAWLYNLVSRRSGGIEIKVEEQPLPDKESQ